VPGLTAPGPAATAGPAAEQKHLPQLDGLRAIAVLAVLVSHLTAFGEAGGGYGVALFFALSGYLITGILWRSRALVENGQSLLVTLRQFYIRRGLRILPIVYLVLAAGWILGDPEIRRLIWWHLGYVSNFLFAVTGYPEKTAHFWSLAVEEQFYLVWPLFIILCPRRALVGVICGLILLSAVFRIIPAPGGIVFPEMLTPTVSDALCFGALLTLSEGNRSLARIIDWAGPFAAAFTAASVIGLTPHDAVGTSAIYFCRGLAFAWVIGLAVRGGAPLLNKVLGSPAPAYIGKISYGIYVYHPFIDALYAHVVETSRVAPMHWLVRFSVVTLASIGAAAISWHLLEAPINALKRYFPYAVAGKRPILPELVSGPTRS
jgi:peptidoglycan/LPS O-acetylase OafA/YrhL